MSTILVAGATGNTGRPLVEQSLEQGHTVRVIVRSKHKLSTNILEHPKISIVEASILDLSDKQMADIVKGCDAVVSCLGHELSIKGIFGAPKKLCTDATHRLCTAIEENKPMSPTKFILMNTVGVSNPDEHEQRTWFDRIILLLLSWFLPPHSDNTTAAQFLHRKMGRNNRYVEWCSIRPDTLINADRSIYELTQSPQTEIFGGRPTTRANVADFMRRLIEEEVLWETWRFKMPVIMNAKSS